MECSVQSPMCWMLTTIFNGMQHADFNASLDARQNAGYAKKVVFSLSLSGRLCHLWLIFPRHGFQMIRQLGDCAAFVIEGCTTNTKADEAFPFPMATLCSFVLPTHQDCLHETGNVESRKRQGIAECIVGWCLPEALWMPINLTERRIRRVPQEAPCDISRVIIVVVLLFSLSLLLLLFLFLFSLLLLSLLFS